MDSLEREFFVCQGRGELLKEGSSVGAGAFLVLSWWFFPSFTSGVRYHMIGR
jgi:hypothetical protein